MRYTVAVLFEAEALFSATTGSTASPFGSRSRPEANLAVYEQVYVLEQ
jgi:hypothetical protein